MRIAWAFPFSAHAPGKNSTCSRHESKARDGKAVADLPETNVVRCIAHAGGEIAIVMGLKAIAKGQVACANLRQAAALAYLAHAQKD
jgi:hypothetical protein